MTTKVYINKSAPYAESSRALTLRNCWKTCFNCMQPWSNLSTANVHTYQLRTTVILDDGVTEGPTKIDTRFACDECHSLLQQAETKMSKP